MGAKKDPKKDAKTPSKTPKKKEGGGGKAKKKKWSKKKLVQYVIKTHVYVKKYKNQVTRMWHL